MAKRPPSPGRDVLEPDAAALRSDEPSHDGQSQAGPARAPDEPFEDALRQLGGHTGARIHHADDDALGLGARGDGDGRSGRCVVIRVGEEVVDDLAQPLPVGDHLRASRGDMHVDLAPRVGATQAANRGVDRVGDVEAVGLQVDGAALDARHVEHVGHQAGEALRGRGNVVELVAQRRFEVGALEHRGGPREDSAQGRAQLVGDVGEELVAHTVGLLEHLDLAVTLGQSRRDLGRLGLFAVEAGQVQVGALQLVREGLGAQLGVASQRAEGAHQAGGSEEDEQVDDVLCVADRQRVLGRDEEVVDEHRAERGRYQGGADPDGDAEHCDDGQVEEGVVAGVVEADPDEHEGQRARSRQRGEVAHRRHRGRGEGARARGHAPNHDAAGRCRAVDTQRLRRTGQPPPGHRQR